MDSSPVAIYRALGIPAGTQFAFTETLLFREGVCLSAFLRFDLYGRLWTFHGLIASPPQISCSREREEKQSGEHPAFIHAHDLH